MLNTNQSIIQPMLLIEYLLEILVILLLLHLLWRNSNVFCLQCHKE